MVCSTIKHPAVGATPNSWKPISSLLGPPNVARWSRRLKNMLKSGGNCGLRCGFHPWKPSGFWFGQWSTCWHFHIPDVYRRLNYDHSVEFYWPFNHRKHQFHQRPRTQRTQLPSEATSWQKKSGSTWDSKPGPGSTEISRDSEVSIAPWPAACAVGKTCGRICSSTSDFWPMRPWMVLQGPNGWHILGKTMEKVW